LSDASAHAVPVTDATVRKDFYTVPGRDGQPTDVFEQFFSQLEGDAVPGLTALTAAHAQFPQGDQRASLSMWIALQHLRSEGIRNSGSELRGLQIQVTVGTAGKQRLRAFIEAREGKAISGRRLDAEWADLTQPGGTHIQPDPRDHIASIMDLLPGVSGLIHHSPWMLMKFARRTLVTSDHPVFLIRSPEATAWEGVGLANAFGYGIPLDRHTGLIIVTSGVEDGTPDHLMPPTTFYANLLNQQVILNARKALYHHPDDDPRVPMGGRLPAERGTEMRIAPRRFPEEGWGGLASEPSTTLPSMHADDGDDSDSWTLDDLPWPIPGRAFRYEGD
jgi:hypothetical protein